MLIFIETKAEICFEFTHTVQVTNIQATNIQVTSSKKRGNIYLRLITYCQNVNL